MQHPVERALLIATCMAELGHGSAVAQMLLLCREFSGDRALWTALARHRGPQGRTRLMHAAMKGDTARAGFLVDRGAAADCISKKYESAMVFACQGGSESVARLLVISKPEVARERGDKPLLWACTEGHLNIVRYLVLDKRADVNARQKNGFTPLLLAVSHNHLAVVRFLLGCSAINVNATLADGCSSLMMACERGQLPMVRCLAEARGAAVGAARPSDGKTALMLALDKSPGCTYGHGGLEMATCLLRHGAAATINTPSASGESVLSRASSAGNGACIMMLVSHGANVNVPAPATPPLILALAKGHERAACCLLLYGADCRAVDAAGCSALQLAVRGGHQGAVRALLEHGADCRAVDAAGCSVLLEAARGGHQLAVAILIKHGADPKGKDAAGTPVLVAASREGYLGVVRALLEGGADCLAVDAAGCTPLLAALRGRHLEIAGDLIKRGANPRAVDAVGSSLLLLACAQSGAPGFISLLCSSGADANAAAACTDAAAGIVPGTTPLMLAAAHKASMAAVKVLLQHGAAPHAKDSAGREAADYAADKPVQKHLMSLA
jgi:ankyrin repeat protein